MCGEPGTPLAGSGAEDVGVSSFEARPLGNGASARPHWHGWPIGRAAVSPRDGAVLWPAGRRVLPLLLPPVDRQVKQPVAVIHPRRRVPSSSRSRRHWMLVAGNKRCTSCPDRKSTRLNSSHL